MLYLYIASQLSQSVLSGVLGSSYLLLPHFTVALESHHNTNIHNSISLSLNLCSSGEDIPRSMRNKVIISLDLASMLAGAKFRGEFEERLKGVLKDIEQAGERIILFIDEMHILVGAGGAEGAIDAANILKPPLARGQLRCMGATTTEEYRKYIEKDAALARRFQVLTYTTFIFHF